MLPNLSGVQLCGHKAVAILASGDRYAHANAARKSASADRLALVNILNENGAMLKQVPDDTPNYKELALVAMSSGTRNVFQYVKRELQHDRDIVLAAVKGDRKGILFVPEEFQDDREVELAAVKANAWALTRVALDKEMVLAALEADPEAIVYADEMGTGEKPNAVWHDPDVLAAAGFANASELDEWLDKRSLYRAYQLDDVIEDAKGISSVDKKYQSDKEFMLAAAKAHWNALDYIHNADKEVVLAAVKAHREAIVYADRFGFRCDPDVLAAAGFASKAELDAWMEEWWGGTYDCP